MPRCLFKIRTYHLPDNDQMCQNSGLTHTCGLIHRIKAVVKAETFRGFSSGVVCLVGWLVVPLRRCPQDGWVLLHFYHTEKDTLRNMESEIEYYFRYNINLYRYFQILLDKTLITCRNFKNPYIKEGCIDFLVINIELLRR